MQRERDLFINCNNEFANIQKYFLSSLVTRLFDEDEFLIDISLLNNSLTALKENIASLEKLAGTSKKSKKSINKFSTADRDSLDYQYEKEEEKKKITDNTKMESEKPSEGSSPHAQYFLGKFFQFSCHPNNYSQQNYSEPKHFQEPLFETPDYIQSKKYFLLAVKNKTNKQKYKSFCSLGNLYEKSTFIVTGVNNKNLDTIALSNAVHELIGKCNKGITLHPRYSDRQNSIMQLYYYIQALDSWKQSAKKNNNKKDQGIEKLKEKVNGLLEKFVGDIEPNASTDHKKNFFNAILQLKDEEFKDLDMEDKISLYIYLFRHAQTKEEQKNLKKFEYFYEFCNLDQFSIDDIIFVADHYYDLMFHFKQKKDKAQVQKYSSMALRFYLYIYQKNPKYFKGGDKNREQTVLLGSLYCHMNKSYDETRNRNIYAAENQTLIDQCIEEFNKKYNFEKESQKNVNNKINATLKKLETFTKNYDKNLNFLERILSNLCGWLKSFFGGYDNWITLSSPPKKEFLTPSVLKKAYRWLLGIKNKIDSEERSESQTAIIDPIIFAKYSQELKECQQFLEQESEFQCKLLNPNYEFYSEIAKTLKQ